VVLGQKTKKKEEKQEESEPQNRGKLILDATCAPGDISYPTDLGLLNQARKQTEKLIDILYEQVKGKLEKKPRSYRERARKNYLEVAKKRRVLQKKEETRLKNNSNISKEIYLILVN
jgi:transposase, IS5 family